MTSDILDAIVGAVDQHFQTRDKLDWPVLKEELRPFAQALFDNGAEAVSDALSDAVEEVAKKLPDDWVGLPGRP